MFLSQLCVNAGDDPDRPCPGRQWVGNLYRVHQRLWMAFPDSADREADPFFLGNWEAPARPEAKAGRGQVGFLFRVEREGRPRILVQSAQRPDWKYAFQNARYLLADEPKLREFDPSPREGELYRFRLLANVVQSTSAVHPGGEMRKSRPIARRVRKEILVHPLPFPTALPADGVERVRLLRERWDPWRDWLRGLGSSRGFRIVDDERSPLLMQSVHTVVRRPRKNADNANGGGADEKRYNAGLFDGVLACTSAGDLRSAIANGVGHGKAFGFGLLSIAPLRDKS